MTQVQTMAPMSVVGQKQQWAPSCIGVRFAPDSRHDTRSIDLRLRAISERGKTCQRMLRQMLLVHAWAGLTLRRRARKSLTRQNTMDLDRSEDLDWSMDGADPWDFC